MNAQCEKKPGQVHREMMIAQNLMAEIHAEIVDLDQKISPILQCETPQVLTADKAEEELVPMANVIRNFNRELTLVKNRIRSIKNRVEI